MTRTDDEVMVSALKAYYLEARHSSEITFKPEVAIIRTKEKRRYVVVRDVGEVVVYRIRNDGRLKRIKRLPEEVMRKLKL